MTGKPGEIDTRRDGESATVVAAGEIDASTAGQLDAAIREAEESETSRVVVDLSELSFIDSTALEVLLRASSRSRENDTRLRFVPSKHDSVTTLIALTCTAEIFE